MTVEEHNKYYQKRRASKNQIILHKRHLVIETRMREVIVDEHCIMCSIRPELGCQVCIDKRAANLVHDGEVESLGQSI